MTTDHNLAILLLEDQGVVRAGIRALIQISEPCALIQEASCYDEAVEKLKQQFFDIAFIDVDLKGEKSGLDLLKYLRSMEIDTRAIMLSGHAEKEIVLQCITDGASGFILKDMESDGLFRRALDTVFQGSIFLPASVFGRGGFSPNIANPAKISAESLGIHGRPLEVLYYICQGLPTKSISNKMGIEEGTVRKYYIPKLFKIFNVLRRTELIIEVSRRGISVPTPTSAVSQGSKT